MHTVVEPYLAGDIDTALDRAEADPRAARALELLRAFEAAYREGVAHAQAKRALDAIAALERADQADRALAQGRPGKLGQEVRKGLSNLHTQVALTQTADDQLAAAAAHLRAAVMDDPERWPMWRQRPFQSGAEGGQLLVVEGEVEGEGGVDL